MFKVFIDVFSNVEIQIQKANTKEPVRAEKRGEEQRRDNVELKSITRGKTFIVLDIVEMD